MRLFPLLLLGFGIVMAGACTQASSPDEQCIVGGGVCFNAADIEGCPSALDYPCSNGFTCCAVAYGANIVNGEVKDASAGIPDVVDASDAATADTGSDSETDAKSTGTDANSKTADAKASDAKATTDTGASVVGDAAK